MGAMVVSRIAFAILYIATTLTVTPRFTRLRVDQKWWQEKAKRGRSKRRGGQILDFSPGSLFAPVAQPQWRQASFLTHRDTPEKGFWHSQVRRATRGLLEQQGGRRVVRLPDIWGFWRVLADSEDSGIFLAFFGKPYCDLVVNFLRPRP